MKEYNDKSKLYLKENNISDNSKIKFEDDYLKNEIIEKENFII